MSSNSKNEQSNTAASQHWNKMPVGSQRSTDSPGDNDYFEHIRNYRYGYETPFIPKAFEFHNLKGLRVLEIGVGNGVDAVEMIKNGAIYTGLDITQKHLDLTKKNIESNFPELKNYNLIYGDLLDTDFPEPFDAIYSFGVLHHIEHEKAYLDKLNAILKRNGTLRVGYYSKYSFFNTYMYLTWLLRGRSHPLKNWQSAKAELTKIDEPVTIKIRSYKSCKTLLSECGFRIKKYHKKGFTQNNIPLVGKLLSPSGAVLDTCAKMLGWYHVFICRKRST